VSRRQLEDALSRSKLGDPPLVSRLTEEGIIREQQALKALSEQSGCPGIDLNQVVIRLDDLKLVPHEMADRHSIVPVLVKGNRMFVAMADPSDRKVLDELEMVTGKRSFPYIALKSTLRRVIAEAYLRREQGMKHYVGPKCSEETLRKAGVSPDEQWPPLMPRAMVDEVPSSQFEKRLRPSNPNMPAVMDNPVIIDDNMAAASASEPIVDEPTFADLEATPPRNGPRPAAGVPAGGTTLLVVDSDHESRNLVSNVFRDRGYQVLEADRGDAVLQLVRDAQPSVILLEATLPQVHGFDIARQLKGSERYRHITIVMMSGLYRGWRFAEDLKANYGVDGFIEKPFHLDDLVHTVDAARMGESAPRAVSAEAEPYLAAGIQAYKQGRFDDAVAQLKAGVDADPLAYKVHFHLGLLYGKLGQIYDAIQELETTLSIRGDFFPALKNLAVLYQNAGFRNKAIEMWERCLAAAPDDTTREQIKQLLVAVL
jgi:DNA-binding response OmpR family regulator